MAIIKDNAEKVMNGIPLIFNERQVQRTVLGGHTKKIDSPTIPCTLLLLNRGNNHYRQRNIDSLLKIGFHEIISIESTHTSYQLEDFSQRYPQVRFVIPQKKISVGEMINIGVSESQSEYIFVIWNDVHISQTLINAKIIENLIKKDLYCVVPKLETTNLNTLPVKMVPSIENANFTVLPTEIYSDDEKTIYPFDFIGFYNVQKFMQLGGFDYTITTPYWQNLDLSLRAWLWGEHITISNSFKLKYDDEIPSEDVSPDNTQLRFFLKNCAPRFFQDYAYIPKTKYFSFLNRYPGTPLEALREFNNARKWVETNKYRYKTDVLTLIKEWQSSESEGE